jgi:hypothetical protein
VGSGRRVLVSVGVIFLAISYQLSAFSFQLSAFSFQQKPQLKADG